MNENSKTGGMFIIGCLVGFLFCYTMSSGNSTNTAGTISAIKEQQSGVNNEIRNASNGVTNASNSVQRVSSTINGVQERLIESERIAINNASGIERCEKIARECKIIADENRKIFNSIGKTDNQNTP